MDEWITKLWSIHTMEFYSAIKKNKIRPFAGKWMELKNIILSIPSPKEQIDVCSLLYVSTYKKIFGNRYLAREIFSNKGNIR